MYFKGVPECLGGPPGEDAHQWERIKLIFGTMEEGRLGPGLGARDLGVPPSSQRLENDSEPGEESSARRSGSWGPSLTLR